MQTRKFGRTGQEVSEIGFGSWGIGGGQWVAVEDGEALGALHAALDLGVTFIDTADVYGDGRSEKLIARALERTRRAAPLRRHQGWQTPAGAGRGRLYARESAELDRPEPPKS